MRTLLLSVVLGLPVVANADLIFVKYEGAVSGIEEQTCPCPQSYSIGDPVSGKLIIDLALVGRGGGGATADMADYTAMEQFNFVSGRSLAAEGKPNDAFFLYNNLPFYTSVPANERYDRVEVYDGVIGNAYDMFGITVERFSPYGQLVTDARFAPEFDATPDEGTTLTGVILRGLSGAAGAFKQTINVSFSHVSMGACRPHS